MGEIDIMETNNELGTATPRCKHGAYVPDNADLDRQLRLDAVSRGPARVFSVEWKEKRFAGSQTL
jgi:hypothetical protein